MEQEVRFSRSSLKKDAWEVLSKGAKSIYLVLPIQVIILLIISWGSQFFSIIYMDFILTNFPAFMWNVSIVFVELLLIVIQYLIIYPMFISIIRYSILYSRGENPSIKVAFNPFKKVLYWRFVGVSLWEGLIIFLLCVIVFVVLALFLFLSGIMYFIYERSFDIMLLIYLLMIFIVCYKSLEYYMAFYLVADNSKIKITNILSTSKLIMKGHKRELVLLVLSFFPWFLLSIVTLGLAFVYVNPYFQVTMAKYYDYVMEKAMRERGISK